MCLNQFTKSTVVLVIAITLNACTLQKEYIQPHLEFDLVSQEIIEKQNAIKDLELYIQSQKDMPQQSNGTQAVNQAPMSIESAKISLEIFKIQMDQLKLKQRSLSQSVQRTNEIPPRLML